VPISEKFVSEKFVSEKYYKDNPKKYKVELL
jgi:hypothetical protein